MSTTSVTYEPKPPTYLTDIYRLDKEGTFLELSHAICQFFLTCPKENCASLERLLRANNCRTYLFPTKPAFATPLSLRGQVCTFELFISREPRDIRKAQQASAEEKEKRLMELEDTGYTTVESADESDNLKSIVKNKGGTFTYFPGAEKTFESKHN